MVGRLGEMVGGPAIFANGAPAPLVTSFTASRVFSRSVNVTKAHDMTLVGGASLNSGIFLVLTALKGSVVGERMNKSFGKEVGKKEMS
jgi:hypothetical protein